MIDLVFELPLWVPLAGTVAGAILWWIGNNRTDELLKRLALGVLGLALVLGAVSWLGMSVMERSVERTMAVVGAVDRQDWPALRGLLEAGTVAVTLRGPEEIAAFCEDQARVLGMKFARVLALQTSRTGSRIDVTVLVQHELAVVPVPVTRWRFTYEVRGDGPSLARIAPVEDGQNPVREIERRFPARR